MWATVQSASHGGCSRATPQRTALPPSSLPLRRCPPFSRGARIDEERPQLVRTRAASRANIRCLSAGSDSPTPSNTEVFEGSDFQEFTPDALQQVLFIESGFGCDQHGQNITKAAVRACRNAIEFNSIPSIRALVPGGYDNMKLVVTLGVPEQYQASLDRDAVMAVFPYGQKQPLKVVTGGLAATSGIAVSALGDVDDTMLIVVAHVVVGY
mmetsp:Transcript_7900/g.29235  ORF Transcript_7900/g.29235 Transcript_7900/m.29235 type:complete len:211 (+) Transcript_7900:53-685(+)